jgi:hypothetical protein
MSEHLDPAKEYSGKLVRKVGVLSAMCGRHVAS